MALAFLCEAYDEEHLVDAKGKEDVRTVLHLHPALAPYKCAVLPLSEKLGDKAIDRKSTRLNSSHYQQSRMPSSA